MRLPNLEALLKWWRTNVPMAYAEVKGSGNSTSAGPAADEILDGDKLVGLLGR